MHRSREIPTLVRGEKHRIIRSSVHLNRFLVSLVLSQLNDRPSPSFELCNRKVARSYPDYNSARYPRYSNGTIYKRIMNRAKIIMLFDSSSLFVLRWSIFSITGAFLNHLSPETIGYESSQRFVTHQKVFHALDPFSFSKKKKKIQKNRTIYQTFFSNFISYVFSRPFNFGNSWCPSEDSQLERPLFILIIFFFYYKELKTRNDSLLERDEIVAAIFLSTE